ncbi:MAG: UDP-3-O-(3-hydroxymyristoyl)glucosamine N-acyltransferase, partial [Woeseiaceae bacterium]
MPISLGELATRFDCELDGDPDIEITRVASLANAGPGTLSFLAGSRFSNELASTKAAAVIVRADDVDDNPAASLICADPYASYALIAGALHPEPAAEPGVHKTAVVAATAAIASSASVGANVFVGDRTVIGENVVVGPGCVIGADCTIGDSCRFIANVTLPRRVVIGKRGVFHPGVVIGADGFGNAMTPDGWVKVPQLGGVRIGDDVEVGANTSIDCGALDDTVLGDGVRIDNLCMIAHNVHIGEHTAMASMTGIAGSTRIGKRCMFAGQAGVVGHIEICDDVVISGQGMVSKDITEPGVYASSFPIENVRDWNRKVARFRHIESLYDRVG